MTREVDLVSYLPPFLAEYKEIAVTLEAENPEFMLVWDAAERVLKNEFIDTADEYGISRFEKILNILPLKEDTLESRRARVQARWFNSIPYTLKAFITELTILCGNSDFTFSKFYDQYRIEIDISLEHFNQVEEVENIINQTFPSNIIAKLKNKILCKTKNDIKIYSGIRVTERVLVTNDLRERVSVKGNAGAAGAVVQVMHIAVS